MAGANEEMRKAWDGPEGESWAEQAEQYDLISRAHRALLLAAAAIVTGEQVLDVGCGNGASTRDAARAVTPGSVVGIDLSTAMLDYARARSEAEGLNNVTFVHGDAQTYAFDDGNFDVVISNSGAMFFDDKIAAFRNLHRALRPGGRLALLAWQSMVSNEWLTALREALAMGRDLPMPPAGMPGPFGLADPDQVKEVLIAAGYTDIALADIREPMSFGADASAAYAFLSASGPA